MKQRIKEKSSADLPCNCGSFLKRQMAEKYDVDANVSPWRPGMVMPPGFDEFGMRCPHGVKWHMEPTSEQRLHWNETRTP